MPRFSLYCDDSGTHDQSEWAIAASIIAPDEQWEKFNEEWQAVANEEGFDVFHMARRALLERNRSTPLNGNRMKNGKGQYESWSAL